MTQFAFIDVDGTLTAGEKSSWELVHDYFGVKDEMEDHSSKYFTGQISYEEWAALDVALWKGRPISDLHKALNPPVLIDGAKEGIQKLQDQGFKVVLLSGGIDIMVNEVAHLVGADFAHSNEIGHLNGVIDGTMGEMVGEKSKVIRELVKKFNIDLQKSVAIGDNFNDIDMFEMVGKSIAINPKNDQLLNVASDVIHTDNFSEAVDQLLRLT